MMSNRFPLWHSVRIIILASALGAAGYEIQRYWVNQLLTACAVKRDWYFDIYDVWPIGLILGLLTGAAFALIKSKETEAARRISMVGGSAVGAILLDFGVGLCWWFNGRPHFGVLWTQHELMLGLIPPLGVGILWAMGLFIRGMCL